MSADEKNWRVPFLSRTVAEAAYLGPEAPKLLQQNQIVRVGTIIIPWRWNADLGGTQYLMIKRARSHQAGTWSFPGGWMDFGETPLEAALRELKEEVGLVGNTDVLKEFGYTNDIFQEEGKHCITFWFRVMVPTTSVPVVNPDEIAETHWIGSEEPLPEPLFLPLQNFLKLVDRADW